MLNQQTQSKLQQLQLSGMAKAYRDQLELPRMQELPFDDRLGLMVDRELSERENRKLSRLLKQAKLRYAAHLEDVDYRNSLRNTGIACSATPRWPRPSWIASSTAHTVLGSRASPCASRLSRRSDR